MFNLISLRFRVLGNNMRKYKIFVYILYLECLFDPPRIYTITQKVVLKRFKSHAQFLNSNCVSSAEFCLLKLMNYFCLVIVITHYKNLCCLVEKILFIFVSRLLVFTLLQLHHILTCFWQVLSSVYWVVIYIKFLQYVSIHFLTTFSRMNTLGIIFTQSFSCRHLHLHKMKMFPATIHTLSLWFSRIFG